MFSPSSFIGDRGARLTSGGCSDSPKPNMQHTLLSLAPGKWSSRGPWWCRNDDAGVSCHPPPSAVEGRKATPLRPALRPSRAKIRRLQHPGGKHKPLRSCDDTEERDDDTSVEGEGRGGEGVRAGGQREGRKEGRDENDAANQTRLSCGAGAAAVRLASPSRWVNNKLPQPPSSQQDKSPRKRKSATVCCLVFHRRCSSYRLSRESSTNRNGKNDPELKKNQHPRTKNQQLTKC